MNEQGNGIDKMGGVWDNVELPPREMDEKAEAHIARICEMLQANNVPVNPMVADFFKDPALYVALPEEIRESDNRLAEYVAHCMVFDDFVFKARRKLWSGDSSGFLGENVSLPETVHHDGRTRRAEEGNKINLEALKEENINPDRVLFFRVTQPSDTAKPEYYWTSDYYETKRGLTMEISQDQRDKAVILVATLSAINQNEGLMTDINDDQGLAVRQIGQGPFDQSLCLARFKAESETEER